MKPKEKNVGTWRIIFPLSEKVGGRVPRVPRLIALVVCWTIVMNFRLCWKMKYQTLGWHVAYFTDRFSQTLPQSL